MRPGPASRRSSRSIGNLLVGFALLLVAGSISTAPATAHTFTKSDGNDSPGKLDIRTSIVGHTRTALVFRIRTYEAWTPASLGDDSYLAVTIDKNNDRRYERCAIILYAARLRAVLTNCGQQIIRNLPVGKPNATTVKVTIPKAQAGLVHWWATETGWRGVGCPNGCLDFSPNRFPDILHDLMPPNVSMSTTPLRTWVNSTTKSFTFPFAVNDAHSGIDTWKVQRHTFESSTWVTVASGAGGGTKSPTILGVSGHSMYRVVAVDKHGNTKIGPTRRVYVPRDDAELPEGGFIDATPTVVNDLTAFRGSYTTLGVDDSLSYDYVHTAGPCRPIELIGPGGGDWTVDVFEGGSLVKTIDGSITPAGSRQVLFSYTVCDSASFLFDITEAVVEFPVDGVVAKAS